MTLQVINNGSADNDGTGDDLRTAFQKAIDNFAELYSLAYRTRFKFVSVLDDLPDPVSSVITLPSGSYIFTDTVDLLGNRLFMDGIVCLFGTSSETASIRSTGLSGAALITTTYSIPMRDIGLSAPSGATLISAIAGSSTAAIDWRAVNIIDTPSIGTISGYGNCIFESGTISNSGGLIFGGSATGTVAFETYFISPSAAATAITIPASMTISRRFRINNSSIVVQSGATGLNVSTSATIPTDGYVLVSVNFSGAGTYQAGIVANDSGNRDRFRDCKGITNSSTMGYMYMLNNATATTISGSGPANAVKMSGTFSLDATSSRFSLVSNKLRYVGANNIRVLVTISASCITTANNEVYIYCGLNGAKVDKSLGIEAATAATRADNIFSQTVLDLVTNDEVDVWVANNTAANNITGQYVSIIISPQPLV